MPLRIGICTPFPPRIAWELQLTFSKIRNRRNEGLAYPLARHDIIVEGECKKSPPVKDLMENVRNIEKCL
jgi:hypothetical protein